MASLIQTVLQKIKLVFLSAPEQVPPADTLQPATKPGKAAGPRQRDKRHSGDKPEPASLKQLHNATAPKKRHRKEINMFPPAKVYAHGRHEIKTRHSKSEPGETQGQERGGHDK